MEKVRGFDKITQFLNQMTQFIGFDAFDRQSNIIRVKIAKVLVIVALCFGEINFVWYTVIYATGNPVRTATNLLLCTISLPLWFQVGQMFYFKEEYLYILEWCRKLYKTQKARTTDYLAHTIFEKCQQFTFTIIR